MLKVDNTLLCDVAKCDAAGVARHVLGLRSMDEKLAADMGNVCHDGLEVHFNGGTKQEVLQAIETSHGKFLPPGTPVAEERFALENIKKIIGRFVDMRPVELFPFSVVHTEEVKSVPLADDVTFYMKRDMLVQDKNTGFYAPLDHKTTRIISEWWSKKYRMLSQLTGYCWGTQQEVDTPVEVCYVNAIELQKVPDSNRKCRSHKVPYIECGPEHIKFELLTYSRTQEQMERWKEDALMLARHFGILKQGFPSVDYLQHSRRNGAFTDGCTFCEYKKWCAAGFRPEMAESFVVPDLWAPWDLKD